MSSNLKYLEKKYVETGSPSIYYSQVDSKNLRYTIELKNVNNEIFRIVKFYKDATSINDGTWYGERVTNITQATTKIYDIIEGKRSNERTESFVDQVTLNKISELATGLEAKANTLQAKSKKVISNIIQVTEETTARKSKADRETAANILKKINFALNPKNLNYEFFSNQFVVNNSTKTFDTVDKIKDAGYKIITLGPDKKNINGTSYDLSYNLLQSVVFKKGTGTETIKYPRVNNVYDNDKKEAVQMISENNDNKFELIGLGDDGYQKYNTNKVAYKNIFQDEFNDDTSLEKLTIEYAYFQTYKDEDEQQFKKIAFLNVVINKDEDMPPTVIEIVKPDFIVSGDNKIKITVRDIDSDNVTLTLTNYTATVNKEKNDGNHAFTFNYKWDGDSKGKDHDMISYEISDGKNKIDNRLILNYSLGTINFEDVPDTLTVFQGMKIPIKVKFSDPNDNFKNDTTLSLKKSPINGNILYTQTKYSIVDDSKIFYLEYLRAKGGKDSFIIKVNSNNRIIEKEISITQKNPSDSFKVPEIVRDIEYDKINKKATIKIPIPDDGDIAYFDVDPGQIQEITKVDGEVIIKYEFKNGNDATLSYYVYEESNDMFYFSDDLSLPKDAFTLTVPNSITLQSIKDSSVKFDITVNDEDNDNAQISLSFEDSINNQVTFISDKTDNDGNRVITYEYQLSKNTDLESSTLTVRAVSNKIEVSKDINVKFEQGDKPLTLKVPDSITLQSTKDSSVEFDIIVNHVGQDNDNIKIAFDTEVLDEVSKISERKGNDNKRVIRYQYKLNQKTVNNYNSFDVKATSNGEEIEKTINVIYTQPEIEKEKDEKPKDSNSLILDDGFYSVEYNYGERDSFQVSDSGKNIKYAGYENVNANDGETTFGGTFTVSVDGFVFSITDNTDFGDKQISEDESTPLIKEHEYQFYKGNNWPDSYKLFISTDNAANNIYKNGWVDSTDPNDYIIATWKIPKGFNITNKVYFHVKISNGVSQSITSDGISVYDKVDIKYTYNIKNNFEFTVEKTNPRGGNTLLHDITLEKKESNKQTESSESIDTTPKELTNLPKSITGPYTFNGGPQTVTKTLEGQADTWKNGDYTLTGSNSTTAAYLAWTHINGYWLAPGQYVDGDYSVTNKERTVYKIRNTDGTFGDTTTEGAYWEMQFPFEMKVKDISFRIHYYNWPKNYILLGYNESEGYIKINETEVSTRPLKRNGDEKGDFRTMVHTVDDNDLQFSRIRFIGIKSGDSGTKSLAVHGPLKISGTYTPQSTSEGSESNSEGSESNSDYTSTKDFFIITDKKIQENYGDDDKFNGVPEIFKNTEGEYFRNKGVLHYLNDYYKPFENWSDYEIYKPTKDDLQKLKRIEFVPQFSDITLKKNYTSITSEYIQPPVEIKIEKPERLVEGDNILFISANNIENENFVITSLSVKKSNEDSDTLTSKGKNDKDQFEYNYNLTENNKNQAIIEITVTSNGQTVTVIETLEIEDKLVEKIPTFFDEVALNFDNTSYINTDTELTLIQKVKNWEFNNTTRQLQMVDQIIEWSYDDKSKFFVSSGGRKFSFVKSKDSKEKFVIGERNTLGNLNPRLRISDFDFKFDLEGITPDVIDEFRIVKDSLLAELEEIKNGNKTPFGPNEDIYKVWLYNNRNSEFNKKLANSHAKGMDFFNTSVDGFIGNEDEYQNYVIRYDVDKGYITGDETSIDISLIRRVGVKISDITYKYYFKATDRRLFGETTRFEIGDEVIEHTDVDTYKNVQVSKYYESRSPLNIFYTTHINTKFEKDGSSRTLTFNLLSGDINYDGGSYDFDSDGYPSGFNPNSSSQLKINYIN